MPANADTPANFPHPENDPNYLASNYQAEEGGRSISLILRSREIRPLSSSLDELRRLTVIVSAIWSLSATNVQSLSSRVDPSLQPPCIIIGRSGRRGGGEGKRYFKLRQRIVQGERIKHRSRTFNSNIFSKNGFSLLERRGHPHRKPDNDNFRVFAFLRNPNSRLNVLDEN